MTGDREHEAAYYLSWTSRYRHPVRATAQFQSEQDAWSTLAAWDVPGISARRRDLLTVIARHRQPDVSDERLAYLTGQFAHHLRITVEELDRALHHPIQTTLL